MNIILDIDGTLWNTTDVIADAWQVAVDETGYSKTVLTGSQLKGEFGKTMDVIARNVFPDVTDEAKLGELIDRCNFYEEQYLAALRPEQMGSILIGDIKGTMEKLTLKNDLFIVSNCQLGYIEMFMRKSGTEHLIKDHLCYGKTLTDKGTTIRILMERNGLSAEETVYVGDTAGDRKASEDAGIPFIYAGYGFGSIEHEGISISRFEDLTDIYG